MKRFGKPARDKEHVSQHSPSEVIVSSTALLTYLSSKITGALSQFGESTDTDTYDALKEVSKTRNISTWRVSLSASPEFRRGDQSK